MFIGIASILALCLACACAIALWHQRMTSAESERAHAERHTVLLQALAALHADMAATEERQLQRNQEQLSVALSGIVADFHHRLAAQFEAQLGELTRLARSSQELVHKQRTGQMEAMHHARRLAGQMDQATQEFAALVAESTTLAALAGQVRASLDLLGPRQDAVDGGLAHQVAALQAMAESVAALRDGLDAAAEQLVSQSRRAFDAMAQRSAQNGAALNKELGETLTKATAGISKQLAALSPMVQQAKRGAEPPRMVR